MSVAFGQGADEPWADALLRGGRLWLVPDGGAATERLHLDRWQQAANPADHRALDGLAGPVLDVGCGPGRMLAAAEERGLRAVGVDASAAAVAHCQGLGLEAVHASVFDPLPGGWGAILLLDGNVGIGGSPAHLLARCRRLLRPGGSLVVEAHADADRDLTFMGRVVDADGGTSGRFPWTEAGERAILAAARRLLLADAWTAGDRRFLRLTRPA